MVTRAYSALEFPVGHSNESKIKGPDQVDYRSDKPLIFLPSQGISDEVRCQFYCFLDADFKYQVEFLKFPLFLSDF